MRVAIIGAGPAGLYLAHQLKISGMDVACDVFEQNPPNATFGFGVVFSDRAMEFFRRDDEETYLAIIDHMEHWEDLAINHDGNSVRMEGIGFNAIGRLELLRLLQARASEVGIVPQYETRISSLQDLDDYDLVVGADGVNSLVRNSYWQQLGTSVSYLTNRFIWYGVEKPFDTLTQTFVKTSKGAATAHHYRFKQNMSTFLIELGEECWRGHGFDRLDEAGTISLCEELFDEQLDGHGLVTNNSYWRQFPKITNRNWSHEKYVLLGDALHTAHFSIGSGTRLAMDDVLGLVFALKDYSDIRDALEVYEERRRPIVKKLVAAANQSADWYEHLDELVELSTDEFTESYFLRSGRIAETAKRAGKR